MTQKSTFPFFPHVARNIRKSRDTIFIFRFVFSLFLSFSLLSHFFELFASSQFKVFQNFEEIFYIRSRFSRSSRVLEREVRVQGSTRIFFSLVLGNAVVLDPTLGSRFSSWRERKEGTKEENSFVSTATEHPEKDILNLFRSLWA